MRQRQSKLRQILGLRALLFVNLVILFFVALSFGREYVRNYEIDKEIGELGARAQEIESKNQNIISLVERLKTNDFLEGEARLKLGLQKPGEEVAVISEPQIEDKPKSQAVTLAETGNPVSNQKLWWLYFFGDHYGE
jgi:cell division protein FtsB